MMAIQNLQESVVEKAEKNIYDFQLRSLDGDYDALKSLKGKVSMLVNVTGECANSPQYTIIDKIYQEYKDFGFEVLAIPSTDFCQDAYGEFAETNANAEAMRSHMNNVYGVDLPFTEMVGIVNSCENKEKYKRIRIENENNNIEDNTDMVENVEFYTSNASLHPLYEMLQKKGNVIHGNFEKFIVSKDGSRYVRFCNSDLLDMGYRRGDTKMSPEESLKEIKKVIENFLKEKYDENNTD